MHDYLALLYGLYFDPESGKYSRRESIKKPGTDSDISLGIFNDEKFSQISAIFFCNTLSLGKLSSLSKSDGADPMYIVNIRYDWKSPFFKIHEVSDENPEHLLDGLYFFKNPYAKVEFSSDEIKASGILEISVDATGIIMEGLHRPVVARYCDLFGHTYKEIIKSTAASNYNNTIAFTYQE